MVWHELKYKINEKCFSNENDIVKEISLFNQNLLPEKCQKYISKLKEVS